MWEAGEWGVRLLLLLLLLLLPPPPPPPPPPLLLPLPLPLLNGGREFIMREEEAEGGDGGDERIFFELLEPSFGYGKNSRRRKGASRLEWMGLE
jgi:hypothetical protein